MASQANIARLEKAIDKYYEDQKKKYHIAPTICEGTHGAVTPVELIGKVLSAGRTFEEVVALEQDIIRELRPNIKVEKGMRLADIIDRENKQREREPKDDRVVKYLERRFGR